MEQQDKLQQTISSFLDRFQPNSEREVAILREIQQSLAAGQSLASQYQNFIALADAELLRSFYESDPTLRDQILAHPNCPADLKPKQTSGLNHPLLALDRDIDLDLKGLMDFEAGLPAGQIEGTAKSGCEARIQNLKRLFDRVPATLHETDLSDNDDPLFYDLLMAKQRISTNQKLFTKLRIALLNRFAKSDPEKEEAPERSLLDQTPQARNQAEEEPEPEQEPEGPTDEELEEEALAALMAEEDARAELDAKAQKKADNQKRQQRLREQAKAQEERSIQEQRRRESEGYSQSIPYSADTPQPTNISGTSVLPPYEYTPYPESPAYTDQAEVLKRQEERRHDEVVQEGERLRSETRAWQEENLQNYQERMDRSRNYESFGKNHIDFSGKDQAGAGEAYPYTSVDQPVRDSFASVPPQFEDDKTRTHPSQGHASSDQPPYTERSEQPRREDSLYISESQHFTSSDHIRNDYSDKGSGSYTSPQKNEPDRPFYATPEDIPQQTQHGHTFIESGPKPDFHYDSVRHPQDTYNERVEWDRKKQEHKDDVISQEQERHKKDLHDRREHAVQDYTARMDRSYEYQSFGHGHIDFSGKEQHGESPFQPCSYAPGGGIIPTYGTYGSEKQPLTNQDIYRAASASGTITPEQSRTMRDNLTQLRQECESAKDTPAYPEAAQRYKEARDAVMAVNKELRSNQISFDHGASPASNSANVAPLRRTEQPNGFTMYNYTPTGIQGMSYQNGSPGGGVVIHNAPGTAGKDVFSPEKPMLVTKAYEDSLYRDAQLAKSQLKDKLSALATSGSTTKISAAELAAYKTSLDAYEGFRRAKADGLVQVSSAAGAHNTPDQMAWAARQETYRNTVEPRQQRRERYDNGTAVPNQDTLRTRRSPNDFGSNNQQKVPWNTDPQSKSSNYNDRRRSPEPNDRKPDPNDFKDRRRTPDPNDRKQDSNDFKDRRRTPDPNDRKQDPNDFKDRRRTPDPNDRKQDSNDSKDRRRTPDPNDRKQNSNDNKDRRRTPDPNDRTPDPRDYSDSGRRRWGDRWNTNWKGAPFGSVFSIHYNRGKYTTGEKETSSRLLNQDTKLQRLGAMRTMGSRLYRSYTMYAPEIGLLAGRKLYTMLQASDESAAQTIRTFEQGRYYGVVGAGVVAAYATRNVGNLKRFEKQVAKAERHQFGFTRKMSDKDISKQLHTRMNESRAAKKDIRRMYEREAGLSVEERRALVDKLKNHKTMGKETTRLVGLQNARVKEKVQREILQELHRNPKGYGLVTENALKELKNQRQQIQIQRRAILKGQPERAAINKRLAELQKKGKANLSPAELEEMKALRGKLSKLSSDPRLKALDKREQEILKLFKKKPDETSVPLKQLRLKDVQNLRAKILNEHALLEQTKFARFQKVQTSSILANKKVLEQQSEIAKRKIKALMAKGKLSGAEEKELRQLLGLFRKNQADIKAHADILKLRNLRDMKIEAIDRVRKTLQKNKQRKRMGKMALIGFITKPLHEGDNIGAQGLGKGISLGMNPYVRNLVRSTVHTTARFTSFAAKKIGKWTGLDKALAPAIDKTKKVYAGARKLAHTPKEYQRKLVKTAADATKRAASRMTPQFIKTGNMAVRKTMTNLLGKLQKSKLGKAYEAVARTLSKAKAMLGTAMKAVTAIAGKVILVFLILFLIVGLITVIGGGAGGSIPSFLIMGDESSEDKIDLKPYYDVIIDEWDEYLDDLKAKKKSGGYYKVTVNMEPEPANTRNILAMMAVRMNQDLDMDENSDIEPYLRSLTRDANPYTAVEGTCYCEGRDCTFYDCGHTAEECPDDCPGGYYDCPGDHKTLTINITPLYFNEIFYADSSGNAKVDLESGELIGYFKITHYCLENYPHICNDGDSSTTASGTKPTPNYTIATDPSIIETGPPVVIDGKTYMAEDTGGAINGYRIDIAVKTHDEALRLGTRENVPVYAGDYTGEGIQTSEEWNGWVEENRDWAKNIYSAPWNELYTGIPNVTDTVGNETDLSGVEFVDGTRAGNQAIVDIALAQLGNTGGQPYWSWYGFDSRVEWCATFVSWCANQQGVLGTAIPRFCSCSLEGVPWFQNHNQWASAGSSYTPVAGDIIFFDWQSDGRPDHVGIVVGSDGSKVYTVEGNSSDSVRTKSYNLNSDVLFGYGLPNY